MKSVLNANGELFTIDLDDEVNEINCGGYALGINTWFHPYSSSAYIRRNFAAAKRNLRWYPNDSMTKDACSARTLVKMWKKSYKRMIAGFEQLFEACFGTCPTEEDSEEMGDWDTDKCADLAVFAMLRAFPWLRVIDSWDELHDDEYGIVFACGDCDFHFVRYEDGVYSHKMGRRNVQQLDSWEEGFGYRYCYGKIFLAAKKEQYREKEGKTE